MALIRPRLTDHFGIPISQAEADFAIPFLDEDLPLYLDPFLLWKSPSQQDNSLHTALTNSFNYIGKLYLDGKEDSACTFLIELSECEEVGFGSSSKRKGKKIGKALAADILSLFRDIPQLKTAGFTHFEEIQLLVDNISKDRVCDIACNLLKSFLIDYTMYHCGRLQIPLRPIARRIYDCRQNKFCTETVELPYNPETNDPVLVVPKRWLRVSPWLNYDSYYTERFKRNEKAAKNHSRIEILNYNRANYGVVAEYTKEKEAQKGKCTNDPLFKVIPVLSAKRRLSTILKLPTGKTGNADKDFEDHACTLMASLMYPQLDFAQAQSRTSTGVLIRDLIFYNNRSYNFLADIYDQYGCRQIVVELKNVKELNSDHVDQLNRYLKSEFGSFGILLTRNTPPKSVYRNTVDLWSGQRRCILILTDEDLEMMVQLYESKQRLPIDVLKKKYVEFTRDCPG